MVKCTPIRKAFICVHSVVLNVHSKMVKRGKRNVCQIRSSSSSAPENAPSTKRHRADDDRALKILDAEKNMRDDLSTLSFSSPVTHVYNPLEYAWDAHKWYVRQYATSKKKVLLVGMNPGPWGMAQTGVPFGEVTAVRDFLRMPLDMKIDRPKPENAKRPVTGLACTRSEVSGKRLWREWAQVEYGDAATFFNTFFVHNYCPLMFMESGGRNRTPVQLRAAERNSLLGICDDALRKVVKALDVRAVCGVGAFAEQRCKTALQGENVVVHCLLHPSPASPIANRGWVQQAKKQIEELMEKIGESEAAPPT